MLYLVKIDNSHLKIGYSTNVASRIKSFQTSSLQVELLAIREGDVKHERELHEVCKFYKIKNELFKDNQFVIDAFKNYIFQPDMHQMKKLEKAFNTHTSKIRKLMVEKADFKKEIEDLNKSLMYYIQEKRELEDRLRNLYIITQEEHPVMEEKTINLNPDKLGVTSMWFNYRKIHPHAGTDVVLVKYKDGIIEFESGLLFYDMKKKKVFTKYFTEAKSYPIGSTSRKYYYYDKDVSISIGDIDLIVDKVNSLFLNKK